MIFTQKFSDIYPNDFKKIWIIQITRSFFKKYFHFILKTGKFYPSLMWIKRINKFYLPIIYHHLIKYLLILSILQHNILRITLDPYTLFHHNLSFLYFRPNPYQYQSSPQWKLISYKRIINSIDKSTSSYTTQPFSLLSKLH